MRHHGRMISKANRKLGLAMAKSIVVAFIAMLMGAPAYASPVSIAHVRPSHHEHQRFTLKMRRHTARKEVLRAYPPTPVAGDPAL